MDFLSLILTSRIPNEQRNTVIFLTLFIVGRDYDISLLSEIKLKTYSQVVTYIKSLFYPEQNK